jgi:predicted nuclease with TOPRIM domain
MVSNALVLCAIIGFIAWYYYQKFQESEKEYYKLHSQFVEVCNENVRLKDKLTDLEVYKDDVSKTFKILDNELTLINDHIKTRNPAETARANLPTNRVSLLTPEMLSTLFNNVNQENQEPSSPVVASFSYEVHAPIAPPQVEEQEQPADQTPINETTPIGENYEKYLINTE